MKNHSKILMLFFLSINFSLAFTQQNNVVLNKVDPFWGVNEGNIFPGASIPFGMIKLGPNIRVGWNPASGYRSYEPIVGFSHNQSSGTGGSPRYGNLLVIPQLDSLITSRYKRYVKQNEYAEPGYYTVTTRDGNASIRSELTTTKTVGYHRYTYFRKYATNTEFDANVIFDVSNCTSRIKNGKPLTYCRTGFVQIVSDSQIEGWAECYGGWGGENPYTLYFGVKFDEPFLSSGVWENEKQTSNRSLQFVNKEQSDKRFGAFVRFNKKNNGQVNFKVSISYAGIENARENLIATNTIDFDQVKSKASDLWAERLNKIQVKGGSPLSQKLFYSALRNTMLMPTDVTGSTNWKGETPHYWDFYCLWDVFRATMPLYTLIYPADQRRMINCLLDIYSQKGFLPDAWIAENYAQIQGGSNADVVIADAVVKKLGGFDTNLALAAVRKNAEIVPENPGIFGRFLTDINKYGYVLPSTVAGSVSRTLEYAYNDFCISQVAGNVGDTKLQQKYRKKSLQVYDLFHPDYKMFWGKDSLKQWCPNFSAIPTRGDSWNDPYFYEGGSIIYSTYLPHDMSGLITRMSGNKSFIKYLDYLFDSDIFKIENEPEFLVPYLYVYAGDYASTAKHVKNILTTNYVPGNEGLPGQDDSGSMSAWYVFSSMGFFPVAGQDLYLIGTPQFEETTIQLEGNKTFIIKSKNLTDKNIYVTKATLNGKKINQAWFKHSQICNGGKLELEMSDKPNNWGNAVVPPSLSNSSVKIY